MKRYLERKKHDFCGKKVEFYFQVDRVIFCLFLDKDVDAYEAQMQKFFPVTE